MVQWTKCNHNNRFVNLTSLPWLSEISGAIQLAQLGLTDEMQLNFENFKIHCALKVRVDFSLHLTKVQHHYSCTNAFQVVFSGKCIAKLFLSAKIAKPYDFLPIPTY